MGKPIKQNVSPPAASWSAKMVKQIAGIMGLSAVLGLSFNASNPIGIRWSTPSPKVETAQIAQPPPPTPLPTVATAAPTPPLPTVKTTPASAPAVNVLETRIPGINASPLPEVTSIPSGPEPPAAPTITPANGAPPNVPPPVLATPTSWADAKPLVKAGQVVLVDARTKPNYEASHIPGAISLPESSGPEELAAFQKKYDSNTPLIVYCASESCSLSKRLADKLIQYYGYRSVRYMTGGYQEWLRSERIAVASVSTPSPVAPQVVPPVAAPTPASVPTASTNAAAATTPPVIATPISWAEAKPMVAAGEVVLVDARPKALYEASHIPGAISFPEASPAEDLQAFQQKYGKASKLIIYCGSQSCSLSKRLADRLVQQHGYTAVRFMTGGFQEWQKAELSGGKPGI